MKNYVLIGGTSGIGLEVVKMLAAEGNSVFILSRTNRNLEDISNASFYSWDATGDIPPAGDFPVAIDGLVYCPGTVNLKPFHRLTTTDFLNDYKVNVEGAVKAIQFFLPMLKAAENPSIVLFSTVAVKTGMLFHSSIATAKGAVEGLTRSLAADFAPKIRVNCVAPSLVQTPLTERLTSSEEKVQASAKRHPLGRIGQVNDIAQMVCFLLSDKAGWISGEVLHVDGGLSSIKTT